MEPRAIRGVARGRAGGRRASGVASGEQLFVAKACNTCHRPDSSARAPILNGLFGTRVTLQDGAKVTADENYIRESIVNPGAKVVQGYQPVMPTFKGQVTEEELIQLVNYVKTLKAADGAAEARNMTTSPNPVPAEFPRTHYLNAAYGLTSWLLTHDHKRIAHPLPHLRHVFFALGGLMAVLIRIELATPGGRLRPARHLQPPVHAARRGDGLPLHHPGHPGGARELPHPAHARREGRRVPAPQPAVLVHLHRSAALFALYALINGGVDTGWTFYTPLLDDLRQHAGARGRRSASSSRASRRSSPASTSSSRSTRCARRASRGSASRSSCGRYYATSIIQVLATPVLAITLLLLAAERFLHIGIFDPKLGGDPVLFQHFFWFYSHPAVYIMIVPGMGVVSELIAAFCAQADLRLHVRRVRSLGIALLGFLVWGHHMFVAGMSSYATSSSPCSRSSSPSRRR